MHSPISQPALHRSDPIPVLLRDPNTAHEAFASIRTLQRWLVPIDATPVSLAALEYVLAHADSSRVAIHLVNVQPPIMSGSVSALTSAQLVQDLRRSAGEHALQRARSILDCHGFRHTSEVVLGETAAAIVSCAEERGCTKIVMAARRSDGIANVMRRSVSRRVV